MGRVLVVTEIFSPEKYPINDLYRDWQSKGYSVDIFTRNPSYPKDEIFSGYKNSLFSAEKVSTGSIYRILVFLGYKNSRVIKILNYFNYCLFLFLFLLKNGKKYNKIFFYQTGPLSNILAAIILKRFFQYKITIWIQDFWPQALYAYGFGGGRISKSLIELGVKMIYNRIDQFVVSSEGFGDKLQCYRRSAVWIPNWHTDAGEMQTEKKKFGGTHNFTFAGNIGTAQNLASVIKGFRGVGKKFDAFLNIIGDGAEMENIKDLVIRENIGNVRFMGFLPLQQTSSYLERSDFLVLSLSSSDAFNDVIPSKFQVYLSHKKPIFAITNGVCRRYVKEGALGLTADPNDISSVADAFYKLLKINDLERKKIAKRCGEFSKENFDKSKLLSRFEKLIFG